MYRTFLTTVLVLTYISSLAQSYTAGPPAKPSDDDDMQISLSPYYGYNFDETFDIDNGSVFMEGSGLYGISLGAETSPWSEFELTWQHQLTNSVGYLYQLRGNNWQNYTIYDKLALDYFTLGCNGMKEVHERITLYGGLAAGVVVFTPQTLDIRAATRFAVTLKAGVRLKLTDNLAIRLQPQLYMPIQSVGADVFIGSNGPDVGISGYSTITQFGGIGSLMVSF